ncbi:MAG: response regulator transcription factor [Thermodesulfovibrionales bacterium]
MIRILVADDHIIFRQGLLKLLQATDDITVVGDTGNGSEVFPMIEKEKPDIVILDISLPGVSGFDIAAMLQQKDIKTKIIFLTMHNDPLTAKKAMQSNASGFVIKDNAFEDLLYAIRAVNSGGKFISPSLSDKIFSLTKPKEPAQRILTERECEVLRLIASGLTNRQIAAKLFISIKTVDTHRTRILQKLGAHTAADLVRYAIKIGLIESQ